LENRHRGKPTRYRSPRSRRKRDKREICPVCNRPLNTILTAIKHRGTGKKAHFDCVIKELKKYYCLKSRESIYYLGGGSFGVIETTGREGSRGFVIKKRIQYEER